MNKRSIRSVPEICRNVHREVQLTCITVAVVICAIVMYYFDPSSVGFYPRCPFHLMTGLHCPGCGTIRALAALVHGNPRSAMAYNPLAVTMLPLLLTGYLSLVSEVFSGPSLQAFPRRARATWVLAGMIVVFWVLRNIAVYPFTLLAPGDAM